MIHIGVICPETPGHLNPMTALADALSQRGHRVTFFALGDAHAVVTAADFEVMPIRSPALTPDDYRSELQKLGTLGGRAALKHTIAIGRRASAALLDAGPQALRASRVDALLVDQTNAAGATVADVLNLPYATICNALLLHSEPDAPPFFSQWQPHDVWWARFRNRIAWAVLERALAPNLRPIQNHRRMLGLPVQRRFADTWSSRLQISQQPEAFEFPRRALPKHFQFVGSLQRTNGVASTPFPWERLDGRPLIYASLGTLQNRVAAIFRTIAMACDDRESQLVISTGGGIAPEALGHLPGRPVVVPFAPQVELIRRSSLVITHAGLNTALESLSAGVPMVAVPVTNDQPGVAARIVWTGSGEALSLKRVTTRRLRALVSRVRREPSYRQAAERIRDSIQAGGGAARAAELVEQCFRSAK